MPNDIEEKVTQIVFNYGVEKTGFEETKEAIKKLIQSEREKAVREGIAMEAENIKMFVDEGTTLEELKFYIDGRYNATRFDEFIKSSQEGKEEK